MIQQRIHETVTDPDTGEKLITRIRGRATVDIGGGPVSVQTFWTPDPALVITGELDQNGIDLVARQYAYVCESAARWAQGNPTWPGIDAPGPVDIVDRKKKLVATALAADLAKPVDVVNKRAQPEQGQPAKSLTAGDVAILEIDGEQLNVEITDVEDDPTYLGEDGELRELQITYRIADGQNRSGELGVTTLVEDEKVLIGA